MKKVLSFILATTVFASFGASGHHSVPAYFDMTKMVTVSGTLKEFKFQNPHSIMVLFVQGPDGQVVEWKAEASLAAWLLRNGWTPDMFPPGVKLTLTGNPARDTNAKMIRLFAVVMPDGRKLNANNGSPTS